MSPARSCSAAMTMSEPPSASSDVRATKALGLTHRSFVIVGHRDWTSHGDDVTNRRSRRRRAPAGVAWQLPKAPRLAGAVVLLVRYGLSGRDAQAASAAPARPDTRLNGC